MAVQVKRAYLPHAAGDGTRVLVDRLWPRGLKKVDAHVDAWLKDVAPSDALRRWFHARPSQWLKFRERYLAELEEPAAAAALDELHDLTLRRKHLTLLFASRDEEHNNAVVLKELLTGMRKPPRSTGPVKAAASATRKAARARG